MSAPDGERDQVLIATLGRERTLSDTDVHELAPLEPGGGTRKKVGFRQG